MGHNLVKHWSSNSCYWGFPHLVFLDFFFYFIFHRNFWSIFWLALKKKKTGNFCWTSVFIDAVVHTLLSLTQLFLWLQYGCWLFMCHHSVYLLALVVCLLSHGIESVELKHFIYVWCFAIVITIRMTTAFDQRVEVESSR